jgi:hypothetical protein
LAPCRGQSRKFDPKRHPQVEHLEIVVITPHGRQSLGPLRPPKLLRVFLQEVCWHSLEELSQRPGLDPLLNLLTLPVRPESELAESSQQILASRPDLNAVVLPMLMQRFPQLTREQIMVIAGIPLDEIRHTRAAKEWLEEGRQQGRQEGEAREAAKVDPPSSHTPLRHLQPRHHRPDRGPSPGATGGPGGSPARFPGASRLDRLAGRQHLKPAAPGDTALPHPLSSLQPKIVSPQEGLPPEL